ncbi:MAG TPA: hypothetical protein VGK71_03000 [Nitrospirota bacterium]
MLKRYILTAFAFALLLAGCSSSTDLVKREAPGPASDGRPAVFGKISLIENINGRYLPVQEQDAWIYLRTRDASGKLQTKKISCASDGSFGVYLSPGTYDLALIAHNGYRFVTNMKLTVPANTEAIYAGTVVLDGSPGGTVVGKDYTNFAYTVRDDQKEFVQTVKAAAPDANVRIDKYLIAPRGGIATGEYPRKVFRAKDVNSNLAARSDAAEDAVSGAVETLSYIINPIWIFGIH